MQVFKQDFLLKESTCNNVNLLNDRRSFKGATSYSRYSVVNNYAIALEKDKATQKQR
jgi:hypothetical protein